MDVTHYRHSVECEGLRVEYDLCVPGRDKADEHNCETLKIDEASSYEQKIAALEKAYGETLDEIERLTYNGDGLDFALSVSAGFIAGLLDIFLVKGIDMEWGSNAVNKFVIDNAKKQKIEEKINQSLQKAKERGKELSIEKKQKIIEKITKDVEKEFKDDGENSVEILKKAITFFEGKYKLPGDNVYQTAGRKISSSSHHLDDPTHHPTIMGLVCSIITQFTKYGLYQDSKGCLKFFPVENELVGSTISEKVFAGTINWFWHLVSDVAGSHKTAGAGMGIPGPIMALVKEFAMIPGINKTPLHKFIGNLFENRRIDFRDELTVGYALGKQAIPVLINEAVVRSFYFIRHMIIELQIHQGFNEVNWENTLPCKNRTIVRMMTISTGTMEVIDLVGAGIQSGGCIPVFLLHVNFVGIGRFAVAGSVDMMMGMKKQRLELAIASADAAKAAQATTSAIDCIEQQRQQTQKKLEQLTAEVDKTSKLIF